MTVFSNDAKEVMQWMASALLVVFVAETPDLCVADIRWRLFRARAGRVPVSSTVLLHRKSGMYS